jgi:hypothetical protein
MIVAVVCYLANVATLHIARIPIHISLSQACWLACSRIPSVGYAPAFLPYRHREKTKALVAPWVLPVVFCSLAMPAGCLNYSTMML